MKNSLTVLAVLTTALCLPGCASMPAAGAAQAGETVTIPPERLAQCQAQGGCSLFTFEELLQTMPEAYHMGAAAAAEAACRRPPL